MWHSRPGLWFSSSAFGGITAKGGFATLVLAYMCRPKCHTARMIPQIAPKTPSPIALMLKQPPFVPGSIASINPITPNIMATMASASPAAPEWTTKLAIAQPIAMTEARLLCGA
ncbi:MAG: hypothetical protein JWP03_1832 [Phycisphaerales bacterium]|nr:hypothetical protein [Phycisphaerales bacterium]